jgi:hypothetical protein
MKSNFINSNHDTRLARCLLKLITEKQSKTKEIREENKRQREEKKIRTAC